MSESNAPSALVRSERLNIEPMRATAAELLAPAAPLPRFDDLEEVTARLRGYLQVLIPQVEDAAPTLPEDDPDRQSALTSIEKAHRYLAASPGPGLVSATQHARGLANSLASLCNHFETLPDTHTVERA